MNNLGMCKSFLWPVKINVVNEVLKDKQRSVLQVFHRVILPYKQEDENSDSRHDSRQVKVSKLDPWLYGDSYIRMKSLGV